MNNIKKKFPDIQIDGFSRKIYSLDLSGGGTEISTLRISFLSDEENDKDLTPNTSKIIKVTIGSFYTFTGYITSITKRRSMSGKITEISLVDRSIILDKFYVGLRGKHGGNAVIQESFNDALPTQLTFNDITLNPSTASQLPRITIFKDGGDPVPEELILLGSVIDPCKDIEVGPDPCDPCSSSGIERNINCKKNRNLQILEVDYSFIDLLSAMSSKKIPYDSLSNASSLTYRAQHTGSLRDVLTTWCQELGFSFYFNAAGSIVFFDVSRGINIRDENALDSYFNDCIIEDRSVTTSIEQNTQNINIAYFGKNGETKEFNCNNSNSGSAGSTNDGFKDLKSINLDMAFGDKLQDVYSSISNFKSLLAAGYYGKEFRDLYCWFKILNFKEPNPTMVGVQELMGWDIGAIVNRDFVFNNSDFTEPTAKLTFEIFLDALDGSRRAYILNNQGYLIFYKETGENFFELEQDILSKYAGRYFYGNIASLDHTVESLDGTITKSSTLLRRTDAKFQFPDLLFNNDYLKHVQDLIELQQSDGVFIGKIILLNRDVSLLPSKQDQSVQEFIKGIQDYFIEKIEKSDRLNLPEGYKVLLIPNASFSVNAQLTKVAHPNGVVGRRPLGFEAKATSDKIDFNAGDATLTVYFPQDTVYGVKITRGSEGSGGSSTDKVLIPKLELIQRKVNKQENFLKTNMNFISITDNRLGNIERKALGKCSLNISKIEVYAKSILDNFIKNSSQELKTITYSLFGIPSVKFRPEDGLNGFSIKMDSSGTRTTLSFSNKPPIAKSIEYKREELEYMIKNQSAKNFLTILK